MTLTSLRRKKDRMYGVTPSGADYLALIDTGGSWLAAAYIDGTWVADIATQALGADPNYSVAFYDDRYIVAADYGAISVWDLDTDTVETYTVPVGWLLLGGGISGGAVYWIEIEEAWGGGPVTFDVDARLRSAADPADLATVTTVETHTLSDNFEWEWADPTIGWFALNGTAAIAQRRADDAVSGETLTYFQFRFPLSGAAGSDNGGGAIVLANVGIPEASGGSFLHDNNSSVALQLLDDDVSATPTDHWPADAPWQTSPVANLSTNVAGTEVAAFGINDGENRLTRSSNVGTYTTPSSQFIVNDHPTDGTPTFFFIRG